MNPMEYIDNRLTWITPTAGQTFAFAYDSADRRTSLTYPNGVTATYSYDTRSRLTGLVYNTSTASTIEAFSYTLDNVGNRLTRTDSDYQYSYTYDANYRLTQSEPTPVTQGPLFSQSMEAFTYDAVGNRLTAPVYPKETAYSQNYSYDYDNRLASATRQVTGNPNADTISFKYDPFGRRIEKNVSTYENGTPTTYKYTYVYDNEDIILEVQEKTQNGNTVTTNTAYTHGPGIDEPLSLERGGNKYYYHADGLGSITSMTNSTEAVVNRYAYDSFGAIDKSESIRNAYAYTGREYDFETGLYYYRARYYDPEAGRFVTKDPIGFKGGDVNVYGMVKNNPINYFDPLGLWSGIFPGMGPDWHHKRNMYQDCPEKQPETGACGKDSDNWYYEGSLITHGGYISLRGIGPFKGYQCVYDSEGNLIEETEYKGTYDYTPPYDENGNGSAGSYYGHFWDDVLPWFIFGN